MKTLKVVKYQIKVAKKYQLKKVMIKRINLSQNQIS